MKISKVWQGVLSLLLVMLLTAGCGATKAASADPASNSLTNLPAGQVGEGALPEAEQAENEPSENEPPENEPPESEPPESEPPADREPQADTGEKAAEKSEESAPPASSAVTETIETTLEDGAVQKGSKKTFEVRAKDGKGNKIPQKDIRVTLNGQEVPVTWDDSAKTSYTLLFAQKGLNTVLITAGQAKKTYTIAYEPVAQGGGIGQAVVSVEAFTISGGYLIKPLYAEIKEGENGAQLLNRVLKAHGYSYENTGTLKESFYLAVLHGGDLPLQAAVPAFLKEALSQNGFDLNEEDDLYDGGLGEFNYTQGAGWMYCVNNEFPNVGFSDYYPAAGDVLRLQFTLAYGLDIGGASAIGNSQAQDYYPVANKDGLTTAIAAMGWEKTPEKARGIVMKLNASQSEVDEAVRIVKEGKQ